MVFGMLIAFGETRFTARAAPVLVATVPVPAPVYRFVPGVRMTLERPGSMVNSIVDGARPLDAVATMAVARFCGTANVSVPPPALLMLRAPCATPGLQLSCARNTVVDCGIRIG